MWCVWLGTVVAVFVVGGPVIVVDGPVGVVGVEEQVMLDDARGRLQRRLAITLTAISQVRDALRGRQAHKQTQRRQTHAVGLPKCLDEHEVPE